MEATITSSNCRHIFIESIPLTERFLKFEILLTLLLVVAQTFYLLIFFILTMESKNGGDSIKGIPSWAMIDFEEIEVGDRIGGGGVGIIYKGWWKDKPVALKALFDSRISEDLRKEYMDELLIMSRVDHSNIVKFLGASMTPPNLCFVMEICECSLHHLLHVERIRLNDYEMLQMAVSFVNFHFKSV